MSALVRHTADGLDFLRARFLRVTLSPPLLRALFINRAHRLFALYLGFIAIALAAACLLPLWQLLLGPMAYGVAHLFTSVRYFHHATASDAQRGDPRLRRSVFGFLASASLLYALYRAARTAGWAPGIPAGLSEWQGSAFEDALFIVLIFAGASRLYRKSAARTLLGAALLAPVVALLWADPLATAGLLILVHNLVAFVYWILLAGPRQDRRFAWAALGVFLLINAAIFGGALDPLLSLFAADAILPFAGLSTSSLGRMILPWSGDPSVWLHATVAFAFGQSTHYYVWLKAIPDQAHTHPVPTSFKQSYRLLGEDFGRRAATALVLFVVLSALLWVFLAMPDARSVYFLAAGFHGFLEIAGLAVARPRRSIVAELSSTVAGGHVSSRSA